MYVTIGTSQLTTNLKLPANGCLLPASANADRRQSGLTPKRADAKAG